MKTAWTEKCFNSTLVQLKGKKTSSAGQKKQCFNSTLVQLKELHYKRRRDRNLVSILP